MTDAMQITVSSEIAKRIDASNSVRERQLGLLGDALEASRVASDMKRERKEEKKGGPSLEMRPPYWVSLSAVGSVNIPSETDYGLEVL